MNPKLAAAFLLLSVALAAGCGAARPSKYYQLTMPSDLGAETPSDPYPVSLLLGTLMASHLYREDRIVYSSSSESMGAYEYHRWAEPPTEMIEEVLLRELRASGRYRGVNFLRSGARGDYVISGRLYDFKEVSGSPLSARVTFELTMRDNKTASTVWNHSYSHDEPVSGKDVPAVVAALNRNVQRGVNEFRSSLNEYFSAHPVNPSSQ
ncbi:MAG: ABC-type transport auxiliary lipoprotein family protein [Candidatus Acidiferrales bacterium]